MHERTCLDNNESQCIGSPIEKAACHTELCPGWPIFGIYHLKFTIVIIQLANGVGVALLVEAGLNIDMTAKKTVVSWSIVNRLMIRGRVIRSDVPIGRNGLIGQIVPFRVKTANDLAKEHALTEMIA